MVRCYYWYFMLSFLMCFSLYFVSNNVLCWCVGGDSALMNSIMHARIMTDMDAQGEIESTWSSDDDN